jgi:alkanesulfonate monooxygenase SsuD/methylene tetrahydromethanopterin reductase-like flavin-dependent oxidoreductase (luciferase family)
MSAGQSFPLFGYDLSHYEALFEEKLNLFAELLKNQPVTWNGQLRTPLSVYPLIKTGTLRTWVGVGGSPESVVRAAYYGLPLILAIIGGNPLRFLPYASCTISRSNDSRSPHSQSARIHQVTSQRATNKPKRSCGRTTRV